MDETINIEKREKIKKFLLIVLAIFTLSFIGNFDKITNTIKSHTRDVNDYNVQYGEDGYIFNINNGGETFKFKEGVLI